MEFLQPILDGIGYFFSSPPVNQILGALIAAGFGLGAFYVQTTHREKAERRRVARAILHEMLQTANFLLASMETLNKARHGTRGMLSHELTMLLPNERKIYSVIGGEIGVLSDQAGANAVAYDGTLQALERDFAQKIGLLDEMMYLGAADCGWLADRVSGAVDLLSVNISEMVNDAYGSRDQMTESTRKMIQNIQSS